MSLLFSYNLANYMTGYWLCFIISFRPVYDFFLSFCWLAGSGGLGQHATLPGLGEGRGLGLEVDIGQDLNYFLWL